MQPEHASFYTEPAAMTSAGQYAPLLKGLPDDIGALAAIVQGLTDPAHYGLSGLHESGAWWIAGNLMRDAAALRSIELLPWDCWGAMPTPTTAISADVAGLLDRMAALTRDPDAAFGELRELLRDDERVRVPPVVRNAVRDREEII